MTQRMQSTEITIPTLDKKHIQGELTLPSDRSTGIVIFCHGSGSSRFSPRNKYVAGVLQTYGMGTLLMDLLTRDEEAFDQFSREHRFNIPLLTNRVLAAIDHISATTNAPIATFGSSTGGASALWACHDRPEIVKAAVSRGGRVDLVPDESLPVDSPVLCLVGSLDRAVIEMNRATCKKLNNAELKLIPGATHLFEEPGTLEQVARSAAEFCLKYLKTPEE